jgi:hypothetical protein
MHNRAPAAAVQVQVSTVACVTTSIFMCSATKIGPDRFRLFFRPKGRQKTVVLNHFYINAIFLPRQAQV